MVDAVNFCLKVGVYDHNEWDDLASVKVLQALLLIYWFDCWNLPPTFKCYFNSRYNISNLNQIFNLLLKRLKYRGDRIEKEGLICWSTYLQ